MRHGYWLRRRGVVLLASAVGVLIPLGLLQSTPAIAAEGGITVTSGSIPGALTVRGYGWSGTAPIYLYQCADQVLGQFDFWHMCDQSTAVRLPAAASWTKSFQSRAVLELSEPFAPRTENTWGNGTNDCQADGAGCMVVATENWKTFAWDLPSAPVVYGPLSKATVSGQRTNLQDGAPVLVHNTGHRPGTEAMAYVCREYGMAFPGGCDPVPGSERTIDSHGAYDATVALPRKVWVDDPFGHAGWWDGVNGVSVLVASAGNLASPYWQRGVDALLTFSAASRVTTYPPFANVLSLDGEDDYARIADDASIDVGVGAAADFTLEAFVYVPNTTDDSLQTIFYKQNTYALLVDFNRTTPDVVSFRLWHSGSYTSDFLTLSRPGDLYAGWHHVAAVFDNEWSASYDRATIYLDGAVLGATTAFDLSTGVRPSALPLTIGAGNGASPFHGLIDEARISSCARYHAHFLVPRTRFTRDAYTRALWRFDEADGATSFADVSGHGNTAVGANGARNVWAGGLAPDGSGTMTASVSAVAAGAQHQTLVFTYTAARGGLSGGTITLTVPAGWSAPSRLGSAAGYTAATVGTVSVSGQVITVSGVSRSAGEVLKITYGSRAGGGPGATAPGASGSQSWVTKERSSSTGTLTAVSGPPVIRVG